MEKIYNLKEKHHRDYYIEHYNNFTQNIMNNAKNQHEFKKGLILNFNLHGIIEHFVKPSEQVDFKTIYYYIDNALELGYQPIMVDEVMKSKIDMGKVK